MARARVQEIMTGAYDQDGLAAFYCDVFGMRVVWRRRPAPDGSRRGLFLSDGYMVLCIQQAGQRGGQSRPEGLQGIGMVIDDLDDVNRLAVPCGAPGPLTPRPHPDGEGFVDAEVFDPVGTLVNLTMAGFGTEPLEDLAHMPPAVHPKSLPDLGTGIRRVVFEARNVESLCGFYRGVFELDEIDAPTADCPGGSSLTDGRTDLWFEPLSADSPAHTEGRMVRFTFVVDDAQETLHRAANAGARAVSPRQPRPIRATSAYVVDPVGVRVDVSERPRAAGVTSTSG
jgi:predicted enzyme related to lactoylglutathione lyase